MITITRSGMFRIALYAASALVLFTGFSMDRIAEAQSGGSWQSCYQTWFGMMIGPAECGSPPAGSECYPGCSGPLGGFCPADYCWSVFVPDPPPACASQGQACSSAANSCGMTGSGTIDSSCNCTASTPSDALCPPPTCSNGSSGPYPGCPLPTCADYGQLGTYPNCYSAPVCAWNQGYSCSSPTNACGVSNAGSVQCDGSCSATSAPTPVDACPSDGGLQCSSSECTVVPPSQANLTAGSISPTTASAGSNVTFSASVTNNGGASTGASFPNVFQIQGSSVLAASTLSALGAGGSANATYTLANAPAGTYTARLCADNNTSWSGSISESNEGDNCGPWTTVTITAGASAPSANLTASPTTIASGDSSTLTWSSSDATSCTGGGFSTGGATSGTRSVSPSSTATYTLQCTGPGGSDTDSATVTVSGGGSGSCTGAGPLDVTATPDRVQPGSGTTITWTGSNVSSASCSVTNVNTGASIGNSTVTTCGTSGSATVAAVTAQTTFRLTCGSLVKDVIVNVVPKFEEF